MGTAEVKVKHCRAKLPSDLVQIISVYIPNYYGMEKYYLLVMSTNAEYLFLQQKWKKLRKCSIDYVSVKENNLLK